MDNTKWERPTTKAGKRFAKMKKVRFHWRTRKEGLKPGFTKPNVKKNRVNTGPSLNLCAGIINCQVIGSR